MNFDPFIFVVRFFRYLRKRNFLEKSDTQNSQNLVIHFTPETLCRYTEWQAIENRVEGMHSQCGRSLRLRIRKPRPYRFLISLQFGT